MFERSSLPDVTSNDRADIARSLQWVGMEEIAIPMMVSTTDSTEQQVSAHSSLYVSLDKLDAKGIHMSRLHLLLNQHLAGKRLEQETVQHLLSEMVASQAGISRNARLVLNFDLVLEKPALLSGESAYQAYPICIEAEQIDDAFLLTLGLTIPYSSTCPCSASLSRQLYADALDQQFSEDQIDKESLLDWVVSRAGSVATPHSQRSYAYLKLSLSDNTWPDLSKLIFGLEGVIGTPVQTAVKRQDEQAFARLNAENLMFCEDAARRIKSELEQRTDISDYWFKVEHQESLHAHNAVVVDQKFPAHN